MLELTTLVLYVAQVRPQKYTLSIMYMNKQVFQKKKPKKHQTQNTELQLVIMATE